jgi:hypothetical protein
MKIVSASITALTILLLTCIVDVAQASPNGAPVCTVGVAAPGSTHLSGASTGSLASAGYLVAFNGVDLKSFNGTIELNATSPIKVEVIATTTGSPFKGVLVVVSKVVTNLSGRFSLSTTEQALVKISDICTGELKSGFTHVDNSLKQNVSATLDFAGKGYADLKLDVNVVLQNNEFGSKYYYDQYTFTIKASPGSPTSAPTRAPTGAPVFAPIKKRNAACLV